MKDPLATEERRGRVGGSVVVWCGDGGVVVEWWWDYEMVMTS